MSELETAALKLAHAAKEKGCKLMVGNMTGMRYNKGVVAGFPTRFMGVIILPEG